MDVKLITSFKNEKYNTIAVQLGKLSFIFFLVKGMFWLGLTGWFLYMGSGAG